MILWGCKTQAFFDIWSFEHLLSGLSIGMICINYIKFNYSKYKISKNDQSKLEIILILMCCFAWEMIEHYLELGICGNRVKYWFYGQEHWTNRLLSDNIIVILGYLICKKYTFLVNPSRIISFIFLFFHIIIFPHSMYLHTLKP